MRVEEFISYVEQRLLYRIYITGISAFDVNVQSQNKSLMKRLYNQTVGEVLSILREYTKQHFSICSDTDKIQIQNYDGDKLVTIIFID